MSAARHHRFLNDVRLVDDSVDGRRFWDHQRMLGENTDVPSWLLPLLKHQSREALVSDQLLDDLKDWWWRNAGAYGLTDEDFERYVHVADRKGDRGLLISDNLTGGSAVVTWNGDTIAGLATDDDGVVTVSFGTGIVADAAGPRHQAIEGQVFDGVPLSAPDPTQGTRCGKPARSGSSIGSSNGTCFT